MGSIKRAYTDFKTKLAYKLAASKLSKQLATWDEDTDRYGAEKTGEMYEQAARAYFLANNPEKAAGYFREAADAYTQASLEYARGKKMTAEEEQKSEVLRKKAIKMSALEKKIGERNRGEGSRVTLKELWKNPPKMNSFLTAYLTNSGLRIIVVGALIASVLFFSNNLTGNVIGVQLQKSPILGTIFLIICLVIFWFLLRKKKKK